MMWDDKTETKEELEKSIKDIVNLSDNNRTTLWIISRVWEVYQAEVIFAQLQDNATTQFQGKLIKMHWNITSTINILEKIIPISEKVCNDQDNWSWLCSVD